jgi:hypothetical protein
MKQVEKEKGEVLKEVKAEAAMDLAEMKSTIRTIQLEMEGDHQQERTAL